MSNLSAISEDEHILSEDLYQFGMEFAACPTAPGKEDHVRKLILARLGVLKNVTTQMDEFGNLIAIYDHNSSAREPIRLVAHMDHPGFVVKQERLVFRGGVKEEYFVGNRVRFHSARHRNSLGESTITQAEKHDDEWVITVEGKIPPEADLAVWALPPARCTKRTTADHAPNPDPASAKPGDALFFSPNCDDLIQVATIVALFTRLADSAAETCLHALFTRNEEVGFHGALLSLQAQTPLPRIVTLSLEISPGNGWAEVGGGPVLRVGDRLSVFDTKVSYWLQKSFANWHVEAEKAKAKGKYLPFQRKLMGGGSCEGTVFTWGGFPTGGVCLPMFHYHNMGPEKRVEPEAVSLRDWQSLYEGLCFLVTKAGTVQQAWDHMEEKMQGLCAAALKGLDSA
jgi:endoglucanase